MTKKSQLAIIFFTVFLYLVGFGIVIPITPILSQDFGATAFQTGLLLSVYSLMQFLFSPFWGQLSDRMGRRPILLFCLLGESIAYILFAKARSLEMLFVARLAAGFFGASISTASAYISDITPPAERSKGMALIGAAFGLGFVVGPALGGLLTIWGKTISSEKFYDTSFTAYWVSGLCFVTFLFGLKFLTESLKKSESSSQGHHHLNHKSRLQKVLYYFKKPTVGSLVGVFFLSSLAMSTMEATLILFMAKKFLWTLKDVSFGFAYIGVIIVITQGFIVRKLLPKLGERVVLRLGLGLLAVGLFGIFIAPNIFWMAVTMTLLSVGSGLTNPSTLGSISLLTSSEEQGASLGVTQSLASLGRILGPALGGFIFQYSISWPFILAGTFAAIGLVVVLKIFPQIPATAKDSSTNSSRQNKTSKQINEIEYFQFDNLIQNRVPFCLALIDVNLDGWFSHLSKMHLERHQVFCQPMLATQTIQEQAPDLGQAIVLLDSDGKTSAQVYHELESLGYLNVFVVKGGIKNLEIQRQQSID